MTSKENHTKDLETLKKEISELKKQYTKQQLWYAKKDDILRDALTLLNIDLWPKQEEILLSDKRVIVVKAGRNTAKSFNAALKCYQLIWFGSLYFYDIMIKIAGPRAEDTEAIWQHLKTFLYPDPTDAKKMPLQEIFPWLQDLKISTNANTHRSTLTANEDRIKIETASLNTFEAPDLRSKWVDLIILEEFGQAEYPEEALTTALGAIYRPTSRGLGCIYVCGTPPRRPSEAFDKISEESTQHTDVFTLSSRDNPHHDKVGLEIAEEMFFGTGIATEIEGHSTPPLGHLFPEFNVKQHVLPTSYLPDVPYIISIDAGFLKPAIIFMQYINNTVRVFKELNPKKILIKDLATKLKVIIETELYGKPPLLVAIDKASNNRGDKMSYTSYQILKQALNPIPVVFNTLNILTSKGNQVTVLKVLLSQNNIQFDPSCQNIIRSISQASPDIAKNTNTIISNGWKKAKGHDDPLDALFYGIINYAPTAALFNKKYMPDTTTTSLALSEEEKNEMFATLGI